MGCCGVSATEAHAMLHGLIPESMAAEAKSLEKVGRWISGRAAKVVLEVGSGTESIARILSPFYRKAATVMMGDGPEAYAAFSDELRGGFADCLFISECNGPGAAWDAYTRYSAMVRRGGVIVIYDVRKKETAQAWESLTSGGTMMSWVVGGFGVLEVR